MPDPSLWPSLRRWQTPPDPASPPPAILINPVRPVRLQDIADKAGVSRAAVSLALRDAPSISTATRQRIRRAAQQLGYRPNPLISALMTHQRAVRTPVKNHLRLALLLQFSRQDRWEESVPPSLLAGAAARAEQHGYALDMLWLKDLHLTSQRLSGILYARGVPGIIVAPLPVPQGHLRLDWARFSAVAIGPSLVHPALNRVAIQQFDAVRGLVRRLHRRGYQRLGLALTHHQDALVQQHWSAAFLCAGGRPPGSPPVPPLLVRRQDWTEETFSRWFKAYQPEVVLGSDPLLLEWVSQLGLRVPQEVGWVHLALGDASLPQAGLCADPAPLGAAAVDLLVSQIQRNERGLPQTSQTVLLETLWHEGPTIRPASHSGYGLARPPSANPLPPLSSGSAVPQPPAGPPESILNAA